MAQNRPMRAHTAASTHPAAIASSSTLCGMFMLNQATWLTPVGEPAAARRPATASTAIRSACTTRTIRPVCCSRIQSPCWQTCFCWRSSRRGAPLHAACPGNRPRQRDGLLAPIGGILRLRQVRDDGFTTSGDRRAMDITQLILDDHHEQRRLFAILEQIDPADTGALDAVWERLAAFLEVHAEAEEELFYPELLRVGQGVNGAGPEAETKDAIHDHNEIRDAVAEVSKHEVGTKSWYEAVAKANEANSDHMAEEEREG